jgi:two-component system chemotaxis response regulator CheB
MSNTNAPEMHSANRNNEIHVMLVDDSAVIRGALSRVMESETSIKIVSSLANGEMAVSAAKKYQPHVIILDVEMPVMDGLTALPKILEVSPNSKIIMFSSLTEKGAGISMKALSLGAVECIVKPSSSQDVGPGSSFQTNILETIKGLAYTQDPRKQENTAQATAVPSTAEATKQKSYELHKDPMAYSGKPELIAIGSSTGGPQALFNVVSHFKDFDIPIVITQHMPATFTKILAQHIQQTTGILSCEGENGMPLESGHVYVAPGGYHMLFEKNDNQVLIKLDDGPAENFCKPAVDPMFRKAVEIYGQKVLGVILTGMGNDGLEGGKILVSKGARLIAQDEQSSVVWGMPGAVTNAGICSEVLPLNDIGPWIKKTVLG